MDIRLIRSICGFSLIFGSARFVRNNRGDQDRFAARSSTLLTNGLQLCIKPLDDRALFGGYIR